MQSSLKSPPVAIWLTANPAAPGELPASLDQHIEYFSPDLGVRPPPGSFARSCSLNSFQPLAVTFSSPHLTVASLIHTSLTLFAPPTQLEILSITAFVAQSFTILYTDATKIARPLARRHYLTPILENPSPVPLAIPLPSLPTSSHIPPTRPNLPPRIAPRRTSAPPLPTDEIRIDSTPLVELAEGTEYRWKRIFRMPNDDHVRPSTLPATQTRIRVSNTLNVEVHYRTEGFERFFTIGKPVVISSVRPPLFAKDLADAQRSAAVSSKLFSYPITPSTLLPQSFEPRIRDVSATSPSRRCTIAMGLRWRELSRSRI